MSRPKMRVGRTANLREAFHSNKGKVLTVQQVREAVGAVAYWRSCLRDLKEEGANIEAVRNGRVVVGYKCVSIKEPGAVTRSTKKVNAESAIAASKPKAVTKKPVKKTSKAVPVKTVKAAKQKAEKTLKAPKVAKVAKVASAKKKKVVVPAKDTEDVVVLDETPDEEQDPDVLAILQQVGLEK